MQPECVGPSHTAAHAVYPWLGQSSRLGSKYLCSNYPCIGSIKPACSKLLCQSMLIPNLQLPPQVTTLTRSCNANSDKSPILFKFPTVKSNQKMCFQTKFTIEYLCQCPKEPEVHIEMCNKAKEIGKQCDYVNRRENDKRPMDFHPQVLSPCHICMESGAWRSRECPRTGHIVFERALKQRSFFGRRRS